MYDFWNKWASIQKLPLFKNVQLHLLCVQFERTQTPRALDYPQQFLLREEVPGIDKKAAEPQQRLEWVAAVAKVRSDMGKQSQPKHTGKTYRETEADPYKEFTLQCYRHL